MVTIWWPYVVLVVENHNPVSLGYIGTSVRIRIQGPSGSGSEFAESGSRGLKQRSKMLNQLKIIELFTTLYLSIDFFYDK